MVITHYLGRTGNNLFQYAIGRIVAEYKGYNLLCNPIPQFPNAVPITDKKSVQYNILQAGYTCPPPHSTMQHLDLDTVLKHNGLIFLHGYFQKHYYYTPHIEKIRRWFAYDETPYGNPNEGDVVIHFRLGDIVEEGRSLATKPFLDLLSKMDYDKCIIVTDTPKESRLNDFASLPNTFLGGGEMMEDFTLMKNAKRLIISQSTFSWWAAFLGNQKEVYAPLTDGMAIGNAWKSKPQMDDIDLVHKDKFIRLMI
jgi:hypothetical protein